MGFATAIYIGVDAGAGPRDTLMLGISRVGRVSVRVARTCMEITVVVLGWLLGGPVWLGTLIAAFAIGPAVQFAFKILRVKQNLTHTERGFKSKGTEAERKPAIPPTDHTLRNMGTYKDGVYGFLRINTSEQRFHRAFLYES
jgi:hypothetical protein